MPVPQTAAWCIGEARFRSTAIYSGKWMEHFGFQQETAKSIPPSCLRRSNFLSTPRILIARLRSMFPNEAIGFAG